MSCKAVIFDMDGVLIVSTLNQSNPFLEDTPMAGVEELLKSLHAAGYTIAIASGSSLERIMNIVSKFKWEKYFHALVSTDHVGQVGKPDPAVYRHAAELIKVAPENCVVIEDSLNGVRSAKSAGMRCVAVPDPRFPKKDYGEADLIASSLSDERLKQFVGLV